MPGIPVKIEAVSLTSQSVAAGTTVPSPPAVLVTDLDGFPVPGVTVTFAVTGGGGSLTPGTVLTGADGVAQVTSWTLGATPGPNSATATVSGLEGSPVTFSATGTGVVATTVAAASPTSQQATVGTTVPAAPAVKVTGAGGVPAEGVEVFFEVTAGGGAINGATGLIVGIRTGADGIAALTSWRLGPTPGTNTVTATSVGLSGSPVSFGATGLTAGPTTIAPNSTTQQSAQVSTAVAAPPSVRVTDAQGMGVAGVTVQFAVTAGGGSVTPATVVTDAGGIATLTSWTLGAGVGTDNHTVEASVPGLAGSPVVFTASGAAAPPPAGSNPDEMVATSSTSQSAQVGAAVAAPPSVIVRDAADVGVAGVTVQFVVTAGSGIVSSATVVTNGSGIATLGEWRLGPSAGTNNNKVEARVAGLTGSPVVFTASATAGTGQLQEAGYRHALYVAAVGKIYLSGGVQSAGATRNIVRVLDAATRAHLTDVTVGTNVEGLVYANGKVYVALTSGNIGVIRCADDTLLTTITAAGAWYRGVYIPTIDRVLMVQSGTGNVLRINPTTDAADNFLASHASIGLIAYVPSNDRVYLGTSSNTVTVYNPATAALVTTISGSGIALTLDACFAFAAAATEGLYVGASNNGNDRRVAVITPSTNTVRGHVVLGQTGTVTQGIYLTSIGRVAVLRTAIFTEAVSVTRTLVGVINPLTDTLERTEFASLPGATRWGAELAASGLVMVIHQASGLPVAWWQVASAGAALRTRILASQVAAPQVTVAEGTPFAPGDLVAVRRDAQGSYRVRLEWPAQIAALHGLRREMLLDEPTLRGERNYVLNPWARTWRTPDTAPGWRTFWGWESQWRQRDASAWTSVTAQVDGSATYTTTIALRGLTAGDVLEPGDWLNVGGGRTVAGRAVVAGDGRVTVPVYPQTGVALTDGASVTVRRPPLPTWLGAEGHGAIVACQGTASNLIEVWFPVPYYAGLTTLWCTVEFSLWVANGTVQPSVGTGFRVLEGQTVMAVVTPTDTTGYTPADGLRGPYVLSYRHTLVQGGVIGLRLALVGATSNDFATAYVRRFQATLGPEADIQPPMERNADHGALFHAGQRALRDHGVVPVQYTCQAREVEATAPFVPGARVDFRDPARGVTATPRILSVTRTLTPRATTPEEPVLALDNLPPSLSRRLSRSGVA